MRVIAGTFRSRVLQAPRGSTTRPTSDRLRETLFNVIAARVPGSSFADLYAGSGAVGIEAISRGAAHVTFAETARPALDAIRANLRTLGIAGSFRIESGGDCSCYRVRSASSNSAKSSSSEMRMGVAGMVSSRPCGWMKPAAEAM